MQSDEPSGSPLPGLQRDGKLLLSVSALALICAFVVVEFVFPTGGSIVSTDLSGSPPVAGQSAPGPNGAPSFADLVEKVKPAVVSIRVRVEKANVDDNDDTGSTAKPDDLPPRLRELLRRFGQAKPEQGLVEVAQGSGFFISSDGYVVTNNHVVDHARSVLVTTDDGQSLDATIIGVDPKTDIALLKVRQSGKYPFVNLGHDAPRIGDWVVAVGNPFGLGGTVTAGIVSARGRDIGAGPYDDFIQTDAPINRGNSGGPSFNLRGEVIGMNTAILSPSGGSIGLAFAIPASTIETVVGQLESGGQATHGYLGVQVQPLTQELVQGLNLGNLKGAMIDSAQSDAPASKAGLKAGDIITAINGKPVETPRELTREIGVLKPGAKVELTYSRQGSERTVEVELAGLPSADVAGQEGDTLPRLGLDVAQQHSKRGTVHDGVGVVGVDPNGVAAANGIRLGDIILEIGGKAVSTRADVNDRLIAAQKEGRKAVLLTIKGPQGTRFLAITMPKSG